MNHTAIVRNDFRYRDLGIAPRAPLEVMPCHPRRN